MSGKRDKRKKRAGRQIIDKLALTPLGGELMGRAVKSHILPKALFLKVGESSGNDALLIQGHRLNGNKSKGFHDSNIMTDAGESIINRSESPALRFLEKGLSGLPTNEIKKTEADGILYYTVSKEADGAAALEMFCATLLWRAAVTNIREFSNFRIPNELCKKLANAIREDDLSLVGSYSITIRHVEQPSEMAEDYDQVVRSVVAPRFDSENGIICATFFLGSFEFHMAIPKSGELPKEFESSSFTTDSVVILGIEFLNSELWNTLLENSTLYIPDQSDDEQIE